MVGSVFWCFRIMIICRGVEYKCYMYILLVILIMFYYILGDNVYKNIRNIEFILIYSLRMINE